MSFPGHSYCFKVCDNINFLSIVGKELETESKSGEDAGRDVPKRRRRACAWKGGCCGGAATSRCLCFGEDSCGMHVWASLFSTSLRSPEPRVVMGALEVRFIQRQSGGLTLWGRETTEYDSCSHRASVWW